MDDLDEIIENEENENLRLRLILLRSKLREKGEEAALEYIRNEDMLSEYFQANGYSNGTPEE